jgi:hypothetical protein
VCPSRGNEDLSRRLAPEQPGGGSGGHRFVPDYLCRIEVFRLTPVAVFLHRGVESGSVLRVSKVQPGWELCATLGVQAIQPLLGDGSDHLATGIEPEDRQVSGACELEKRSVKGEVEAPATGPFHLVGEFRQGNLSGAVTIELGLKPGLDHFEAQGEITTGHFGAGTQTIQNRQLCPVVVGVVVVLADTDQVVVGQFVEESNVAEEISVGESFPVEWLVDTEEGIGARVCPRGVMGRGVGVLSRDVARDPDHGLLRRRAAGGDEQSQCGAEGSNGHWCECTESKIRYTNR